MDTSTTVFCKFSPLRTPDIRPKPSKKFNSPRKEVSDTDSVVSRDVRSIAKSVSDKLKEDSEHNMMTSDDDIFMSQSKKVMKPIKNVSKRRHSKSDSDSIVAGSESEEGSVVSEIISPKRILKHDGGISPRKKVKFNSDIKSPSKSAAKSTYNERDRPKNHEISDSDSDSVSLQAAKSPKQRKSSLSSVNSVRTSSSDLSGVEKEANRNAAKSSGKQFKRKDSSSSVSDITNSDSDSDNGSKVKGKQVENKNLKNLKENDMSEDSDFDTRPTKKSKKNKVNENEGISANEKSSKLRYKVPEGFEVDTSQQYLSRSDLQGKRLWLITTPDDFDISSLHRQKINMTGSSVVSAMSEENAKQFELVARPFTGEMSTYNSVAVETSESEQFAIGSEITGQIQVMDWIPALPPVELVKPPPTKHRVPDNLKPTFKPFGCDSPVRQNDVDDESLDVHMTEKHKKKKKKKDKKKEK